MPLLVCATPIGNLEDVTHRVVAALRDADLVVAEDTRRTRKLLARYDIETHVVSLDRHAEARRVAELLPRLEGGETLALVSDAGLPALSDPGARLIAAAIEASVPLSVLPGPGAVETALVASGLAGAGYRFVGFVPRTDAGRERLWRELSDLPGAIVAFESPRRLPATLASLARADGMRRVAVCRELTKVFEEVVRGSATEVAAAFSEPTKGEVTIVIGPTDTSKDAQRLGDVPRRAVKAVGELVDAGVARRQAAALVAGLIQRRPNDVYRASVDRRADS